MTPVPSRVRSIGNLGLLDLRLVLSDRASAFWMVVFPIVLMWFFGKAFHAGTDAAPSIHLGVAVEDAGPLGPALLEAIRSEGVTVTPIDATSPDSIREGLRILTVPADFSAHVLAKKQVTLQLQRTEGSDAEFDRAVEVHVYKAIARLLGNLVILEKETGTSAASVPDLPVRYQAIASRPDRVIVKSEIAGRGHAVPSGFTQSVPGTLTMSILMMTVIYGAVFLTFEKTAGVLRRQASLPIQRRDLLAGKLVGRLMVALAQLAILLLAARILFHADFGRSPAGLAMITIAFTVAAAALGLLFGALYRTPEQAGATGWIAPLIMAALGGCWWPLELVPGWMRTAGHLFPTAWAMDGLHRLISFGDGAAAVMPQTLVLLGYGVLATTLAVRFLRWD